MIRNTSVLDRRVGETVTDQKRRLKWYLGRIKALEKLQRQKNIITSTFDGETVVMTFEDGQVFKFRGLVIYDLAIMQKEA